MPPAAADPGRTGPGPTTAPDASVARPYLLDANPVHRFYDGGRLSRRFRGLPDAPADRWSEDWVGSCTLASNAGPDGRIQGLSPIELDDGRRVTLASLIGERPDVLLGAEAVRTSGMTTGLLVKLLSPAGAVPVHAHPDRAWARAVLGSPFGKTEAWIVLEVDQPGGRGAAGIGFRPGIDREWFADAVRRHDSRALRGALHQVEVRAGDVLVAPGGVPHALGPGLSYIEVQEPSDHIVVAETEPGSDDDFSTMGLGWERALDMIDYTPVDEAQARDRFRQRGAALDAGPGWTTRRLLDEAYLDFFDAWSIDVDGDAAAVVGDGRFSIVVVVAGSGTIGGGGRTVEVRRGTTIALPAAVDGRFAAGPDGLRVVRCTGPLPVTDIGGRARSARADGAAS